VQPISREEKAAVDAEVKRWRGLEGKRRKISVELWGVVRDSVPEGVEVGDVRVSEHDLLPFSFPFSRSDKLGSVWMMELIG